MRAQATALFIFKQKAFLELQAFLEENSATVGKDSLEKVYRLATSEPFQVLYVNLKAGADLNNMFFIGFKQRILIGGALPALLRAPGPHSVGQPHMWYVAGPWWVLGAGKLTWSPLEDVH